MNRLFGTNGIRGVVNVDLTADFALKIGKAVGTYFKTGPILIGSDGRVSGLMLKNAIISGLLSVGVNAIDVGLAPTPAIQYAIRELTSRGAVIVTASHNPPEFNGVKVVGSDGVEVSTIEEQEIEKIYFLNSYATVNWRNVGWCDRREDILKIYMDSIIRKVDVTLIKKTGLKVVVDAGNGVGGLVTPYLTTIAGCETITVNSNLDGFFPGRNPEPNDENLQLLKKTVKETGADIGIAHDGDADRVVFVDEKGSFITGDKSFALLVIKTLSKIKKGIVVTPIATSNIVKDVVEQYGGRLITTRVGSVIVARTLKEVDGVIGGEENGGIFYAPHQYVRDGAMGAMLMLEYLAETGEALSKLIEKLPKYYQVKKKLSCPDSFKEKLLNKLKEKLKNYNLDTTDGLKIYAENGWVLIRASGTEPIVRCYAESRSQKEAERLSKWGVELVDEELKELKS
ncbi:MAG: phosphoglucosamine mutase [Candidatus Odinarchaeum yellowstonii]|uniref:Phosphoglucosamine mutase n=1 Tax=Odinarchaeota yellowstonii (strain LCB_4) TaxID=1841599 RepID=A0AAF0D1A0_ODILC|nr:MAG: phosphoglucosamine mutase [Candidatus Odinarchaeum yellowstonii]